MARKLQEFKTIYKRYAERSIIMLFIDFFLKRGGRSNKLLSVRTKFFRSWHSRLTITTWLIFFGLFAFLANLPMAQEAFAQEVVNCFPGSGAPALEVITLINNWRVSQGLSPLAPDPPSAADAQLHSEDIAAHNFCSHYGSDGSKFINRVRAQGYPSRSGGEMIGCGNSTPSELLAALVSSETHRTILFGAPHHIGVGLSNNHWTVDVGSATNGPSCTFSKAALVLSPIWFQPFNLFYSVRDSFTS